MAVPISQFRKDIFSFAEAALKGEVVEFVHKGIIFQLIPTTVKDKLSNITPIQVVNPDYDFETAKKELREEMENEWEKDWKTL